MLQLRAPLAMVFLTVALSGAVGGISTPVRAQDEAQTGASYLELYPPGDVYQIQVIGDGAAEGLIAGLQEGFRGDARIAIKPKPIELSRMMRNDFPDQIKAIDDGLTRDPATIAVVMLDPQDRVSIRNAQGRRITIETEEWRAEFGREIDTAMKTLKKRKLAVYWVSLPNVRRSEPNEDAQVLNEIIREQVYLNGLKYIDAFAGFTDEGGGYSAMGPDLAGKIRLLRESNGVGFTEAGNRKLAHFVEREIRRDLSQAKSDRTIPLAGTAAEQAAIDPARSAARTAKAAGGEQGKSVSSAAPRAADAGGSVVAAPARSGPVDEKADSGRINLVTTGLTGREEIVSVDLLRPAIPATIVALVNRRETADKPTQLGDLLIDQIPGGLMVMSSITPAVDPATGGTARRLSPTQTPYFRVMVKGERIAARPDRADDVSWPRPDPPPPAPPPAVAVAAPVPAEPAPAAAKPKRSTVEARRKARAEREAQ